MLPPSLSVFVIVLKANSMTMRSFLKTVDNKNNVGNKNTKVPRFKGFLKVSAIYCLMNSIGAPHLQAEELDDLLSYSFTELMDIKITTFSKLPEEIRDLPGTVTLITRQDIQRSGAITLMDLLVRVPGFHNLQDNNEHLASVRGVYATTNHKVLLLRDGHRLNEFLFENYEPDYSVTLNNIQRIEIIRGPGASLYGNASLTAVINIITLDDRREYSDLEVLAGNHGQFGLQGLFRRHWDESSLLLYGSYNRTDGETVSLDASEDYSTSEENKTPGEMQVDRYFGSFDVGLKLMSSDWAFSSSLRSSSYAQPKGNGGQTIVYDDLPVDLVQSFYYFNNALSWKKAFDHYSVTLDHYYDYSVIETWQMVASPQDVEPNGRLFSLEWSGFRAGVDYSVTRPLGSGSWLVGFTSEYWELIDSSFHSNFSDSDTLVLSDTPLLPNGNEKNYAFYSQVKYELSSNLIFNGGARYDHYEGFGSSFNPRVALIYHLTPSISSKLIYAEAFQAPAYFYRNSNPSLGYGSTDQLEPEQAKNTQLSLLYSDHQHWFAQFNLFQNEVTNLITRDRDPDPDIYVNIGMTTTYGLESEISYHIKQYKAWFNHTYLKASRSGTDANFLVDGKINSVPTHTANLGLDYVPSDRLSFSSHLNWFGEVYVREPAGAQHLGSRTTVNVSAQYQVQSNLRLSLTAFNLLDKAYTVGGSVPPYPQPGRWMNLKVSYAL